MRQGANSRGRDRVDAGSILLGGAKEHCPPSGRLNTGREPACAEGEGSPWADRPVCRGSAAVPRARLRDQAPPVRHAKPFSFRTSLAFEASIVLVGSTIFFSIFSPFIS